MTTTTEQPVTQRPADAEDERRIARFLYDEAEMMDNMQWEDCCLLYTSPSPRDISGSRMPSSA